MSGCSTGIIFAKASLTFGIREVVSPQHLPQLESSSRRNYNHLILLNSHHKHQALTSLEKHVGLWRCKTSVVSGNCPRQAV